MGDSGWAYFEIDGDQEQNEYTEALVDAMYDVLDYGSWAGEFQATGEAIYDAKTKTFTGTDYYSEDDNDLVDADIKITVPKKFWFDTLHIECEGYYDETPNISVRFLLRNGFLTDEHSEFCANLETPIKDDLLKIFNNYGGASGNEFRGCNDSWMLERSEAIENGDNLVFTIDKVDIQTMSSDEKSIVLELDEDFVEVIDNKLNNNQDAD